VNRDTRDDERDAASSRTDGIWWSTTAPMTTATAGSSASISANVARDSLAMASWSVT
jgi:hypothetical protein